MPVLLVAGISGLLPDIDYPINVLAKIFNVSLPEIFWHRGITHTPLFALIFLIPALILSARKKHKIAIWFYVITFGIFLHIFLDFLIGGHLTQGVMWFFPFSTIDYGINLAGMHFDAVMSSLDALLLIGWLYHEEIRHKILDFI